MPHPNDRPLPAPEDDHDRQLLADVHHHDWHVVGVEADEEGPGFAYSVGLYHTFGHPEVFLCGLAVPVMHRIVNAVGEQVRQGSQFGHLDEAAGVLERFHVCFRAIARRYYREFLGCARWFYQGDDFPALQCVWPDARQRYPWHPDFHQNLAARQPVFSDENSWPFQEGKNRAVFTTKPVIHANHPILRVSHDAEGEWQFLCGTTNRTDDAAVVSLGEMLRLDPSLGNVADLPEGWTAFRSSLQSAWQREKIEDE